MRRNKGFQAKLSTLPSLGDIYGDRNLVCHEDIVVIGYDGNRVIPLICLFLLVEINKLLVAR